MTDRTTLKKSVLIIGTGLTNSILAGALSRVPDYEITQIDTLEQYGGEEFPMKTLEQLMEMPGSIASVYSSSSLTDNLATLKSQVLSSFLSKFTKRYLIELNPQALYSSGPIVDLLVKSGVGDSILEFQLVKDLMHVPLNGAPDSADLVAERVPSNKEDIFVNPNISLREKRILMKFFTSCLDFNDTTKVGLNQDLSTDLFLDFVCAHKVPPILQETIGKCLTFNLNDNDLRSLSKSRGVELVCLYLKSIGKFGPGALLTANYGTGSELCQSFCRYAAVYGTSTALGCSILGITTLKEERREYFEVETNLQSFKGDILVCSCSQLQYISNKGLLSQLEVEESKLWHIVIVADTSLLSSDQHVIQLFTGRGTGVCSVQYTGDSGMCPEGSFLLHLWSVDGELLQRIEQKLTLNRTCISIKYSTSNTSLKAGQKMKDSSIFLSSNVEGKLTSGEKAVSKAKELFNLIVGSDNECEFYPSKVTVKD